MATMAFAMCSTDIDLYFDGVKNETAGSIVSSNQGVCFEPTIKAGRKMLTIAKPLCCAACSASPGSSGARTSRPRSPGDAGT